MTTWGEQHPAIRATLNPILLAGVIGWAARGYQRERASGIPWPLAYTIPPMVLHTPTRQVLPSRVSRQFLQWRQENDLLMDNFPDRCWALKPHVERALRVGVRLS